jgi:hypothetical protein
MGKNQPSAGGNATIPVGKPRGFEEYIREESPWTRPAWIFFGCVLVFCTMQGNPGWTDPSLRVDMPLEACFWILGLAGAATGWVVARYRLAGLLAGAVAGSGSLLAALLVFQAFTHFPRRAVVLVQVIGLFPGVALYFLLHVLFDRQGLLSGQKGIEPSQADAERNQQHQ